MTWFYAFLAAFAGFLVTFVIAAARVAGQADERSEAELETIRRRRIDPDFNAETGESDVRCV